MENRFIIAALVITACVGSGSAFPARKRMIYYQQPLANQWYGAPQRLMYVHYEQPSGANGRSGAATSALVAGETVATGTYLEDCNQAEANVAAAGPVGENGEGVLSAAGVHSTQSVAEAYPDESYVGGVGGAAEPPSRDLTVEAENGGAVYADVPAGDAATEQSEVPAVVQTNDEAKVPRDYKFERPAPVSPPASHYLPANKKIYFELEHSAEAAAAADSENAIAAVDVEDEEGGQQENEEETDVPAPVVPVARKPKKPVKSVKSECADCTRARAPASGSGSKPSLPAGTFFPIDFGGTSGGATAIANSFSTGEGGTATSHAIAYGSPDAAHARVRPSKLH